MSLAAQVSEKYLRLHDAALEAARSYKRAEAALIDALIAVDRERVFIKMGYSSLFVYAVQALKLSEAVAYNAMTVARKAREVPALREELRQGAITLTNARRIAPVLTLANQSEWFERAKTLSSRNLEREVARENPRAAVPERVTYVSGKRVALTLSLDEKVMLELRRAQDRVSQSRGRAASLEEALGEMVAFYLKHRDPVEKARRAIAKKGVPAPAGVAGKSGETAQSAEIPTDPVKPVARQVEAKGEVRGVMGTSPRTPVPRTPIPAAVAHQVRLRDDGRCQFKRADGAICGERRWTDLHHIKHVSMGGPNTRENLISLCRAHHQEVHAREGTG